MQEKTGPPKAAGETGSAGRLSPFCSRVSHWHKVCDSSIKQLHMKSIQFLLPALAVLLLSSCEVIGGIFKAGIWTGILLVAIVVFVIIFLIVRSNRK